MSQMQERYEAGLDEMYAPELIDLGPSRPYGSTFEVDTDDKAEWALRKLALTRQALVERASFVDREKSRLDLWMAAQNQRDLGSETFFLGLLESYYRRLDAAGKLGKRRYYRLPHGTLKMRSTPGGWEVDGDTGAIHLLDWAKANRLTREKIEVDWEAIKARLAPDAFSPVYELTGEIVPGLRAKERHDSFTVETAEEG